MEYITPAMKIAATATNDASMVEAKVALEKFCARYQSVAVFTMSVWTRRTRNGRQVCPSGAHFACRKYFGKS